MANLREFDNKSPILQHGSLDLGHSNIFDPFSKFLGALDRWAGPLKWPFFNVAHHIWPGERLEYLNVVP